MSPTRNLNTACPPRTVVTDQCSPQRDESTRGMRRPTARFRSPPAGVHSDQLAPAAVARRPPILQHHRLALLKPHSDHQRRPAVRLPAPVEPQALHRRHLRAGWITQTNRVVRGRGHSRSFRLAAHRTRAKGSITPQAIGEMVDELVDRDWGADAQPSGRRSGTSSIVSTPTMAGRSSSASPSAQDAVAAGRQTSDGIDEQLTEVSSGSMGSRELQRLLWKLLAATDAGGGITLRRRASRPFTGTEVAATRTA